MATLSECDVCKTLSRKVYPGDWFTLRVEPCLGEHQPPLLICPDCMEKVYEAIPALRPKPKDGT